MADHSKAVPLPGAKNVLVTLSSPNVVTLLVDLSKDLGSSSTGKTTIVGSSSGNKPLGGSGALVGLNVFAKATRNVKALLDVKGKNECGTGIVWEVIPPHTLSIDMTLSAGQGKVSTSGKTSIVASSSGNRPIGKSGITFGINCFTKVGATVNLSRLAALVSTAATEIADGVTVDSSDAKWTIFSFDLTGLKVGGAVKSISYTAPPDVTVAISLFLQSALPAVSEEDDESAAPPEFAPVEGWLNLESNGGTVSPFQVRFDRTLKFDQSASGKSISVATTHGFKVLGNVKVSLNAYAASPNRPAAESSSTPAEKKKPAAKPKTGAASKEALEGAVIAFIATQKDDAIAKLRMSDVRSFVRDRLKLEEELDDDAKSTIREAVMTQLSKRLGSDDTMPSLSPAPKVEVKVEEECEKSPKKPRTE